MSGWQMAQFFNSSGIRFRELKTFLLQNAERVKRHALYIAQQEGRPHQYLQEKIKKEDLAKQIAERDHIEEGLICIFPYWSHAAHFHFGLKKENRSLPPHAGSVCSCISISSIVISA
jgi:hypothetical protein